MEAMKELINFILFTETKPQNLSEEFLILNNKKNLHRWHYVRIQISQLAVNVQINMTLFTVTKLQQFYIAASNCN